VGLAPDRDVGGPPGCVGRPPLAAFLPLASHDEIGGDDVLWLAALGPVWVWLALAERPSTLH
jgi:hypothetical protein